MNSLVDMGYDVYLITSSQGGRPFYYPLDERIHTLDLDIRYDNYASLSRLKSLWLHHRELYPKHLAALDKALAEIQPDFTIIPDLHEQRFAHRLKNAGRKLIEHHYPKDVWVYDYAAGYHAIKHPSLRTRLSAALRGLWARFLVWSQLQRDRKYDTLVLLTEEDRKSFPADMNIRVIPNPRSLEFEEPSSLTEKVILSVGRAFPQKNQQELIHIWARIAKDYPGWTLRILGDGYMMGRLRELVKEYSLEDQVELCGDTPDVRSHYQQASIFVSTALFEGLPLALLEAETAGLPIVSYACPCGPRDIITDGKDGYLIELGDEESFARSLRRLIEDEELRQQMGQAARIASERYRRDQVMAQWDDLFRELRKVPVSR